MENVIPERYAARFWAKIDQWSADECWIWKGGRNHRGYGVMSVFDDGEAKHRLRFACHLALILNGRPRPSGPGNHALHGECSNRLCMNPSHLRWGTNAENCADRVRLGRANHPSGEASPNAKLTEDQVRAIRADPRKYREIAPDYGVTFGLVGHIKRRRAWAHVA